MQHILRYKKNYLLRIIIPSYPRFNVYSFLAHKTTALGPVCVATSAREVENWQVEIIDENNFRNRHLRDSSGNVNHRLLQQMRPADVVGFYAGLTCTVPRIYSLARFYKQRGVITLAGGQHFVEETIPEALSSGIDCVIRGEAEITIKEVLRAFLKGGNFYSIKGLAFKEGNRIIYTPPRPPIQDLDSLALPDFTLLREARMSFFPVGRVRGCGMNCEFCTVKGKPRYASAEKLLAQVDNLVRTMNAKEFFIVDDLFGQDHGESLRLCRLLEEYQKSRGIHLRFTVQIRLDKARDEELLKAMRQANIGVVTIGFESPIDQELKAMNKQLNSKDILSFVRVFQKYGFFIHGMFIFGYPAKEGVQFQMSVEERIGYFRDFIKKAKIDTIQVVLPVPLPGTQLRQRLLHQGRVYPLSVLGWQYYDSAFPLFEPDYPLSPEEMQLAIRRIMGNFYHIRYLFMFLLNLASVVGLPFYFKRIKSGWRRWSRNFRNYIFRIIGQRLIRSWTAQVYKELFWEKLQKAKSSLTS